MRNRIILLITLLTSLLTACGGLSTATTETVTPLVIPTINPTAAPTGTPAPTSVPVTENPDVVLGKQALSEGRFEYAITLFSKVYAGNLDNPEASSLLADAYLAWGQQSITAATGPSDQLAASFSLAIDRLNNGLALTSPDVPTYAAALAQSQAAATFIAQYDQLTALKQLAEADGDLATRQSNADTLVTQLAAFRNDQPDFPGLNPLERDALLTAAAAYEATKKQDANAKDPLEKALGYCKQAKEIEESDTATACVSRITTRINAITTSTAATAKKLRFSVLNYNDTPSCISIRISGISTSGWTFTVDGLRVGGNFDGGGNARACGIGDGQEVTVSVRYPNGQVVPGGGGVPSKGSAIMLASWR
ncbi:hypothetical protein EKD04_005535 [Chloroflexales bacterium ZM16-3]|nr:hypothetical protein [Chloroflexales bacterium ZM16-3]